MNQEILDLISDLRTEDRSGMRQYEREARIVLRGLLTRAADTIERLADEAPDICDGCDCGGYDCRRA